ncbi:discoidin domain-containing protein [uncultured Paludibaculum sp.]|uniref:glycosyl hydrolase 2 galactose-binding domain-containing protein n=1 Tax=uncultured Paludibaculum sp. TaxID=1765020 RepID=UPI002AAB6CD8|nr:discoidin domain-containing protein [uncultured Paludibaculum sp.]
MKPMILAVLALGLTLQAQDYTRGVGIYPGDPKQHFGPVLRPDPAPTHNLALRRPAYHSSSYDYNLTAQLVTDGIKDTRAPRWVAVSTSQQGLLKKNEREWLLDGNWVSGVVLRGKQAWVQFEIGGDNVPEVDRIEIDARLVAQGEPENWNCTVSGSNDGQTWKNLGQTSHMARPTGEILRSVKFEQPARSRFYRIQFRNARATAWQANEVTFFRNNTQVHLGGPWNFTSAWKPAGAGPEWVSVDLGVESKIERVVLTWIRRAAEGSLEISQDGDNWQAVQPLPATGGSADTIRLPQPVQARYVRLRLTKPATAEGYLLSEFEVFGTGGLAPQPKPAPAARADGRLDLTGGAWRVQRDSLVQGNGPVLSQPGYRDADWVVATVPGTVLTSYYNAGALPDPNFGDNQLMISDSFFHADFWYRNEFVAPATPAGRNVWLNLDGINWKAEVYLNGTRLGRVEGGFLRGRFDISELVRRGARNAVAIRIEKLAHPGSIKEKTYESPDKNGGVPGADNPTYHAAIGWDWIPTIRGRDTGIWNNVYLTTSGAVTLENPFVTTTLPLPDTSRADVAMEVTLHNHSAAAVSGVLSGHFGEVPVNVKVTVPAGGEQRVKMDPSTHPVLRLQNPKLWWPTGYGQPDLYPVALRFETAGGALSDEKSFQAGVRQFTYSEDGGALRMWINGRRFIPRGGNWGFGESMLRYRGREYDAAVRYHREMNFTMIRNWVGQIGEDEFYEACDRHGIVVWQDFWLANPWDGPDPDNNSMFLSNVKDTVLRIRNHASVGLYCGRNEGFPPKPIDDGIRAALDTLHPGIHYISSSADDVVSGHGPYQAMPLKSYFTERATPKFHSEMGMPNIVGMDSLRQMMPESGMWPQGRMWGLHDFCLTGAQGGASFLGRIENSYGGAKNIAEWIELAQFVNYEGHRAMFEAQSKYRMGLLIWMSHPTWPSFVWQTYDYYLEPGAAYFGSKKASEPLHIQWNPATDMVEVVNYSAGSQQGLSARLQIFNLDGTSKWTKTVAVDSSEDSTVMVAKMEYPADLSTVHFLRLELSKDSRLVSRNVYWRGLQDADFKALRELPKVRLASSTSVRREGDVWHMSTQVHNISTAPALMVRAKAVRSTSGDRILPVVYDDNYIALMPGESQTIVTEVRDADTRGEAPRILIEGYNVSEVIAERAGGQ